MHDECCICHEIKPVKYTACGALCASCYGKAISIVNSGPAPMKLQSPRLDDFEDPRTKEEFDQEYMGTFATGGKVEQPSLTSHPLLIRERDRGE